MSNIHRYVSLLDSNHKSNLFMFKFKAMKITKDRTRLQSMIKRFDHWSVPCLGILPGPFQLLGKIAKKKRNLNFE